MTSSDQSPPQENAPSAEPPATNRPARLRTWGIMLMAGVLVGLAGWQCVERLNDVFQLPADLANADPTAGGELGQRVNAENLAVALKNRMLSLAVAGAIGGVLFAVAAALAVTSRRGLGLGLILGIVLGTICGAASAEAARFAGQAIDAMPLQGDSPQEVSMRSSYRGMAVHLATWSVLGLGFGIAAGVAAHRRLAATVLASIGAAAVWGALFPFLGAILFPQGSPESPVPDGTNLRILWTVGGSTLIAVAICRALTGGRVPENGNSARGASQ